MDRFNSERVLLLRLSGVATASAFLAVFLPVAWMQATHERIGIGALPLAPVVDHLSRALALLYGFHGVLLLLLATNVRRFRPIIRFVGWMEVIFGLAMVGIDLSAGMPFAWTLLEGPPVTVMGVALLALLRWLPVDP